MIALFQYTLLNNLIQMTCDEAFAEYTLKFNKMYSSHEEEKKSIFCTNFLELQELLLTDPNLPVGLVERMDVVHQKTVLKAKNSPLNQLQAARNDYCSAINPLPDLSTVYPSVDLREMQLITSAKNQGQCGCCYVFQTMAVLENAVLRDKNNLNSFWQNKADSATLSLSEQFQLSNAICKTCNYCKGGNFVIQTYIMVPGNEQQTNPSHQPIQTIELTENFPYAYAANEAAWKAQTIIAPKLSADNQLLPVKMFDNSGLYAAWCNQSAKVTPTIKIFDDDASSFNASTINTIKSYLSRGIAIAISIFVGTGTPATAFQYFTGNSIIYNPCTTWNMDHAVVLVGYGTKNGKNVWVIKNSWGTGWGDNGFFFVEIGSNSYCTEQYAYTVLPKYFDVTEKAAYPRGTLVRGTSRTLDCDFYFTNIGGVITCFDVCPEAYPTRVVGQNQCQATCPSGQSCVTQCQGATPFKEGVNCVARCSTGAYSGSELICQASCTGLYVLNASNSNSQQCITSCPSATPYYETGACVAKCTSNAYSVVSGAQTLMCQASCTYYVLNASNSNSQQCLSACQAATPYSDAGLCTARCASGAYANVSGILTCQATCTQFYVVNATNSNSQQCMTACPTAYFIIGKLCSATCPTATPYNDSATTCITKCATGAYQVQGSALSCVAPCTGMYIINQTSDLNQCITACPAATPYYQIGACVSRCQTGAYKADSGKFICQDACLTLFTLNKTNENSKQCVDECSQQQTLNGSECIPKCTFFCLTPTLKMTIFIAAPSLIIIIVAVVIITCVCNKKKKARKHKSQREVTLFEEDTNNSPSIWQNKQKPIMIY
ncbi:Cathepsin_L [Hexamita inflata]|uniref:Cathepsin L n=1 Tax=Hexamita inflata TaxID=28002 RepID=A0AA86NZH1_9EUKA|nr:Cathepsin L [Hexamita inflata]